MPEGDGEAVTGSVVPVGPEITTGTDVLSDDRVLMWATEVIALAQTLNIQLTTTDGQPLLKRQVIGFILALVTGAPNTASPIFPKAVEAIAEVVTESDLSRSPVVDAQTEYTAELRRASDLSRRILIPLASITGSKKAHVQDATISTFLLGALQDAEITLPEDFAKPAVTMMVSIIKRRVDDALKSAVGAIQKAKGESDLLVEIMLRRLARDGIVATRSEVNALVKDVLGSDSGSKRRSRGRKKK